MFRQQPDRYSLDSSFDKILMSNEQFKAMLPLDGSIPYQKFQFTKQVFTLQKNSIAANNESQLTPEDSDRDLQSSAISFLELINQLAEAREPTLTVSLQKADGTKQYLQGKREQIVYNFELCNVFSFRDVSKLLSLAKQAATIKAEDSLENLFQTELLSPLQNIIEVARS